MKLNYKEIGQGRTIVFIHSYLWDKNMWNPQYEYFKRNFRCIGIDLPGHGESPEKDISSLSDLALEIKKLLEELKVKKYIYVGLSVGGMIAPHLYKHDKEKIEKIVIMDSYVGDEPINTKNLYFNMLDVIESKKAIPDELIKKIAPIFFTPTIDKKSNLYLTFEEKLKNIPKENINMIVKLGRIIFGRENAIELLKEIKAPTYFLTGEKDIPRPYFEAELMKKQVKNSKIFKIKNAGHISNLENIKKVNKLLKKIFKENI